MRTKKQFRGETRPHTACHAKVPSADYWDPRINPVDCNRNRDAEKHGPQEVTFHGGSSRIGRARRAAACAARPLPAQVFRQAQAQAEAEQVHCHFLHQNVLGHPSGRNCLISGLVPPKMGMMMFAIVDACCDTRCTGGCPFSGWRATPAIRASSRLRDVLPGVRGLRRRAKLIIDPEASPARIVPMAWATSGEISVVRLSSAINRIYGFHVSITASAS